MGQAYEDPRDVHEVAALRVETIAIERQAIRRSTVIRV
jgi:hypothetical protein